MEDYHYVADVPADLLCAVCYHALTDPRCCPRCQKGFCGRCITSWGSAQKRRTGLFSCPFCRAPLRFSQLPQSTALAAQADALLVLCPHRTAGCAGAYPRSHLAAHLATTCAFVPSNCPDCAAPMPRGDLAAHIGSPACPRRRMPCPNQQLGCPAQLPPSQLADHAATCAYEPLACKHCRTVVLRGQAEEHRWLGCPARCPCPHRCFGCPHVAPSLEQLADHTPSCRYAPSSAYVSRLCAAMGPWDLMYGSIGGGARGFRSSLVGQPGFCRSGGPPLHSPHLPHHGILWAYGVGEAYGRPYSYGGPAAAPSGTWCHGLFVPSSLYPGGLPDPPERPGGTRGEGVMERAPPPPPLPPPPWPWAVDSTREGPTTPAAAATVAEASALIDQDFVSAPDADGLRRMQQLPPPPRQQQSVAAAGRQPPAGRPPSQQPSPLKQRHRCQDAVAMTAVGACSPQPPSESPPTSPPRSRSPSAGGQWIPEHLCRLLARVGGGGAGGAEEEGEGGQWHHQQQVQQQQKANHHVDRGDDWADWGWQQQQEEWGRQQQQEGRQQQQEEWGRQQRPALSGAHSSGPAPSCGNQGMAEWGPGARAGAEARTGTGSGTTAAVEGPKNGGSGAREAGWAASGGGGGRAVAGQGADVAMGEVEAAVNLGTDTGPNPGAEAECGPSNLALEYPPPPPRWWRPQGRDASAEQQEQEEEESKEHFVAEQARDDDFTRPAAQVYGTLIDLVDRLEAGAAGRRGGGGRGGGGAESSDSDGGEWPPAPALGSADERLLEVYEGQDMVLLDLPSAHSGLHHGYRAFWALGLLRLARRHWPAARLHWRTLASLNDLLTDLARRLLVAVVGVVSSELVQESAPMGEGDVALAVQSLFPPPLAAGALEAARQAFALYDDVLFTTRLWDESWGSLGRQLELSLPLGRVACMVGQYTPLHGEFAAGEDDSETDIISNDDSLDTDDDDEEEDSEEHNEDDEEETEEMEVVPAVFIGFRAAGGGSGGGGVQGGGGAGAGSSTDHVGTQRNANANAGGYDADNLGDGRRAAGGNQAGGSGGGGDGSVRRRRRRTSASASAAGPPSPPTQMGIRAPALAALGLSGNAGVRYALEALGLSSEEDGEGLFSSGGSGSGSEESSGEWESADEEEAAELVRQQQQQQPQPNQAVAPAAAPPSQPQPHLRGQPQPRPRARPRPQQGPGGRLPAALFLGSRAAGGERGGPPPGWRLGLDVGPLVDVRVRGRPRRREGMLWTPGGLLRRAGAGLGARTSSSASNSDDDESDDEEEDSSSILFEDTSSSSLLGLMDSEDDDEEEDDVGGVEEDTDEETELQSDADIRGVVALAAVLEWFAGEVLRVAKSYVDSGVMRLGPGGLLQPWHLQLALDTSDLGRLLPPPPEAVAAAAAAPGGGAAGGGGDAGGRMLGSLPLRPLAFFLASLALQPVSALLVLTTAGGGGAGGDGGGDSSDFRDGLEGSYRGPAGGAALGAHPVEEGGSASGGRGATTAAVPVVCPLDLRCYCGCSTSSGEAAAAAPGATGAADADGAPCSYWSGHQCAGCAASSSTLGGLPLEERLKLCGAALRAAYLGATAEGPQPQPEQQPQPQQQGQVQVGAATAAAAAAAGEAAAAAERWETLQPLVSPPRGLRAPHDLAAVATGGRIRGELLQLLLPPAVRPLLQPAALSHAARLANLSLVSGLLQIHHLQAPCWWRQPGAAAVDPAAAAATDGGGALAAAAALSTALAEVLRPDPVWLQQLQPHLLELADVQAAAALSRDLGAVLYGPRVTPVDGDGGITGCRAHCTTTSGELPCCLPRAAFDEVFKECWAAVRQERLRGAGEASTSGAPVAGGLGMLPPGPGGRDVVAQSTAAAGTAAVGAGVDGDDHNQQPQRPGLASQPQHPQQHPQQQSQRRRRRSDAPPAMGMASGSPVRRRPRGQAADSFGVAAAAAAAAAAGGGGSASMAAAMPEPDEGAASGRAEAAAASRAGPSAGPSAGPAPPGAAGGGEGGGPGGGEEGLCWSADALELLQRAAEGALKDWLVGRGGEGAGGGGGGGRGGGGGHWGWSASATGDR